MQGGSLFCPRNTELVPTGPVPPSVCPAPGGSPATALRPHARPQLRRRLRHGGCGGAGGGQPGTLTAGVTGWTTTELSLHVALK